MIRNLSQTNCENNLDEKEIRNKNSDNEEDEEVVKPKPTVRGRTLRGAALRAVAKDDDDDDTKKNNSPKDSNQNACGVYSMKLNQTKKVGRDIGKQMNTDEVNFCAKNDNEDKENNRKYKCDTSSSSNSDDSSNSDTSSSNSDHRIAPKKKKIEKKQEKSPSPSPPSSPPTPPPPSIVNKPKRKSTSQVDKQLKELDMLMNRNKTKNCDDSLDESIEEENTISLTIVRVSTKNGIKRWEMNENQTFQTILEDLAKIENTNPDNLVLMLQDHVLKFYDTPSSVNLKVTDILDYRKTKKASQERIQIIEDDKNSDDEKNLITSSKLIIIMLQTDEGRKSRIKFLVSKDETFDNIMKKYCEKKSLDPTCHIIEFDGDLVSLKETPNDLDIDGGEIFDVKKSNKPTLMQVEANKKNYEFDDDILSI